MAASGTTKKISVNNILGASGTATLASATITGALTVDTTTLVVNAAGYTDKVGIGTATPSEALHINRASGNGVFARFQDSTNSNYIGTDSGNLRIINGASQDLLNIQQLGVFAFGDGAGGTRMTLNSTGLLVGVTSALASGSTFQNLGINRQVLTLKGDTAVSYTSGIWNASTTGDALFQYFATETSLTVRGGISYNRAGGLVAYNTTSDYRAKDIIGPVSNSGSLIDSLKVYVGKMKGATIERPMLIAHEAQEVAPYSVTGLKDEVDSDGKDKYQQMDVSSFVPLLIAEIQSLRARVQTLEAR
jgi:hypothetical protein